MPVLRIAFLLALLGPLLAQANAPMPLKLCFEDAPVSPWSMPDGTGLTFELLKRVEKKTGEQLSVSPRPWKRCLEEVRRGDFDGALGAADSAERHAFGTYPTLPDGRTDASRALNEDRFYVYLRVGGAAAWDGKQLQVPANGVLIQRGYVVGTMLRARGFVTQEVTGSASDALRQLAAGMFDVTIIQGMEPDRLMQEDPALAGKITKAPVPYVALPMYLLVGKKTYEADPKRIEALWNAIRSVRKTAEFRALEAAALRKPTSD